MNQHSLHSLHALFIAVAIAAAPVAAHAVNVLTGSHDGNAGGDGFDTTQSDLYVVAANASFSGNSFNGLFDGSASLLVRGGSFEDNLNCGVQVITSTDSFVVVSGGSFSNNLAGLDVYGARLSINAGDFSGNGAYGLEAHSPTRVNGGSFSNNGSFGIMTFESVTSVYGGSFANNLGADFAAGGATIQIFGTFDRYGSFNGSGSFSGTLARGTAAQTFTFTTFSGGSIVLSDMALLSAVPEPGAPWLLLAGLPLLVRRVRKARHLGWAVPALLAACSGGGSDSEPPADSAALALSGTAATGAAIAGRTVDIKCAAGTASTTTLADGHYSVSVAGGSLPCVARVTAADGSVLHTVAAGSGLAATANITPATQLVVASLAGVDPAAFYAAFNATAAGAAAVATAQSAVLAMLKDAGIDLSGVGDLITATLVAKTASSAGNAYDAGLDALASTLADSGTSLATLTSAVAGTGTGIGSSASLPPEMLLEPAAANCAALRSGRFRWVSPRAHGTLADQIDLVTINARTLLVTRGDGSSETWVASGACSFSGDGGRLEVAVSPAGVLLARSTSDNGVSYRTGLAFREQTHTLAQLAGSWNFIGMQLNAAATAFTGVAGSGALDAAGVQSGVSWCQNDTTWSVKTADCHAVTTGLPSLAVDSSGGFAVVDAASGAVSGRAFLYRAGPLAQSSLMLALISGDGSFQLRTKQRVNALPAVGAVTTSWNLYMNNQIASTQTLASSSTVSTIVSVDTAAASWLRIQKNLGGSNDHNETVFANNPRDGYNLRPAGSSTAPNGTVVTFNEWTSLPMAGMGVSALMLPSPKIFAFAASQP